MGVTQLFGEVTGHGQELTFPKFAHRTTAVNWDDVHLLPGPVKRFFVHSLKVNCPLVRDTYFTQEGRLRDLGQTKWQRFQAGGRLSAPARRLEWKAELEYRPRVSLTIEDRYADGKAASRLKLFRFLPVKTAKHSQKLAEASLQRYLAECVFAPTMLLPQSGVEWREISDDCARARIRDNGLVAELDFHFAPTGEVSHVTTPGRWAYIKGEFQLLPWKGTFMGGHWNGGQFVPRYGEVAWRVDGAWHTVWQAKWIAHSFDEQQLES